MNDHHRAARAARSRRAFVTTGLGAAIAAAVPRFGRAAPLPDTTFTQDFDELWETLRDRYCYFDAKRTDWAKVRELYAPQALAAETPEAFEGIVGRVLAELYDAHTHLTNPADGTRRWPLFDLLVERAGADVRIAAVKDASAASGAGLKAGDIVTGVDGQAIEPLVRELAPRCLAAPDPLADAWAINSAVAGRRGLSRTLAVRSGKNAPRDVGLPLRPSNALNVESMKLDRELGYIAIHTFGDTGVVDAFDAALTKLRDTRGLILDVRANGGGDTAVARPLMGRFITERKPYATMRRREGAGLGAPWTEWVDPRGPFTYSRPVVVLVDHWSASMAEGFPMGMRDVGRAVIVGTPMMQLGAAVFPLRLDRSGVAAQYSAEPVYDLQGNARASLVPDVVVTPGRDILAAGIAALEARIRRP